VAQGAGVVSVSPVSSSVFEPSGRHPEPSGSFPRRREKIPRRRAGRNRLGSIPILRRFRNPSGRFPTSPGGSGFPPAASGRSPEAPKSLRTLPDASGASGNPPGGFKIPPDLPKTLRDFQTLSGRFGRAESHFPRLGSRAGGMKSLPGRMESYFPRMGSRAGGVRSRAGEVESRPGGVGSRAGETRSRAGGVGSRPGDFLKAFQDFGPTDGSFRLVPGETTPLPNSSTVAGGGRDVPKS